MENKTNMEVLRDIEGIIEVKCIHGNSKGIIGVASISKNNKPYIFIGDGSGIDDHETDEYDFNNNYKII